MLLTAWVEDSTQTIMAATQMDPDEYEQQSDGLGVASKGYQQITSWQVCNIEELKAEVFADNQVTQGAHF